MKELKDCLLICRSFFKIAKLLRIFNECETTIPLCHLRTFYSGTVQKKYIKY